MICLLHGYGLSGSGSNLWTRSVTQALCRNGEAVHLMCQETDPEALDFVAEAYTYNSEGEATQLFKRSVDYKGRCIMHRPELDLLPVYVQPPKDSTYMRAIPDLDDDAIETYVHRNEVALRHIVKTHGISALHANHVVLMSIVAQRVGNELGIPYAVMPHGSAIEYVVRKDERMKQFAAGALSNCKRIFVLGDEIRSRLNDVFPEVPGAEERMRTLRIGVNTQQFKLVDRGERPDSIRQLKSVVEGAKRGKSADLTRELHEGLSDDIQKEELLDLIEATSNYPSKHPDADIEAKLDSVNWQDADTIGFVGRLIGYKGLQSVIAAFPAILEERPDARLIVTGRGPNREPMEALIWALANGKQTLARNIAKWGGELEGEGSEPFETVHQFFEQRAEEGSLQRYFNAAKKNLTVKHVVFTGYLDHEALCHLYPCWDVSIFPSNVPEGGPMVLVEALASGSYPMGSNHSGINDNLNLVSENLPEEDAAPMRLGPEPDRIVEDIIANAPKALALQGKYRKELRETAIENYAWSRIAETLAHELRSIAGQE